MFQTLLVDPLFNALIFLYDFASFQDFGVAIILLTVLIRIIFLPLFYKGAKNQIIIQRLQPEINRIQHDHKHDREKQAQALMDLYRAHKVNPFSSFFMLFLQLPVLIAIYQVFLRGFSPELFDHLYAFVPRPEQLNANFLGLIDLQKQSILMVSFAALAQYVQGYLTIPAAQKGKELSSAERVARQMVYLGPIFTIMILSNLPSAVGLYWLVTSVFSIGQQVYINKTLNIREEKREHHIS
jgi:YidC/Oxa1 family membrane protein insertase